MAFVSEITKRARSRLLREAKLETFVFVTVPLGLHVVGVPFLLQGGDKWILLLDFRFQSTYFCFQTNDFGFQNLFDFNLIEFFQKWIIGMKEI